MTPEEIAFLKDLQGFIAHQLSTPRTPGFWYTLFTLHSDIIRKVRPDSIFPMLTHGYSKHLK